MEPMMTLLFTGEKYFSFCHFYLLSEPTLNVYPFLKVDFKRLLLVVFIYLFILLHSFHRLKIFYHHLEKKANKDN